MARKKPPTAAEAYDKLSPDEAAEVFGTGNEAFMRDIVDACRRHQLYAVTVCAFTREAGVLAFSTGTDPEWREMARRLAVKVGEDVGAMMGQTPHVSGPRNLRRPS